MAAIVVAGVLGAPGVVRAECGVGVLGGPIALELGEGGIRSPRRACARGEVGLGGGGVLIVQPSEFYGNVRVFGLLSGSAPIGELLEVFGAVELVRHQVVISSLSADRSGFGHTSLGAALRLPTTSSTAFALSLATTLPTAIGLYSSAWPIVLELGGAATTTFGEDVELHGYLGVTGSGAISRADPGLRGGVRFQAGGVWTPLEELGLVGDVEASVLERATLDHVAVALGIRGRPAEDVAIELGVKVPVAGDERSLLAGYLGARWSP